MCAGLTIRKKPSVSGACLYVSIVIVLVNSVLSGSGRVKWYSMVNLP